MKHKIKKQLLIEKKIKGEWLTIKNISRFGKQRILINRELAEQISDNPEVDEVRIVIWNDILEDPVLDEYYEKGDKQITMINNL